MKKFSYDIEVIIFHKLTDVKAPIPIIKNMKNSPSGFEIVISRPVTKILMTVFDNVARPKISK